MVRNIEQYTKDTYSHVPEGYVNTVWTITEILQKNNGSAIDCIFDAWKVGFEQAYRAAKAGKLDFQRGEKK